MTRNRGRAWRRLRAYTITTQPAICMYCLEPIDLILPRSHPMSYEAAHVQAVALGGVELDPSNVKPSHRRCNRSHGIKPIPCKTSRTW